MALETDLAGLGGAERLEADDLGDVTTAFHVCGSGAVTIFATVVGAGFRQREMRGSGKVLGEDLLMTSFAGF